MSVDKPEIEFEHADFDFTSLEDELLVDQRCQELLKHFYIWLINDGVLPEKASELAFSADFYLRDYLLDFAQKNLLRPEPSLVKRFAATWFVTHTLDPEMKVLERHLAGIKTFYCYLHYQKRLISKGELKLIEDETALTDYYLKRIESFYEITGDGYLAWEGECPHRG